jgi:hypothetical protein
MTDRSLSIAGFEPFINLGLIEIQVALGVFLCCRLVDER